MNSKRYILRVEEEAKDCAKIMSVNMALLTHCTQTKDVNSNQLWYSNSAKNTASGRRVPPLITRKVPVLLKGSIGLLKISSLDTSQREEVNGINISSRSNSHTIQQYTLPRVSPLTSCYMDGKLVSLILSLILMYHMQFLQVSTCKTYVLVYVMHFSMRNRATARLEHNNNQLTTRDSKTFSINQETWYG